MIFLPIETPRDGRSTSFRTGQYPIGTLSSVPVRFLFLEIGEIFPQSSVKLELEPRSSVERSDLSALSVFIQC